MEHETRKPQCAGGLLRQTHHHAPPPKNLPTYPNATVPTEIPSRAAKDPGARPRHITKHSVRARYNNTIFWIRLSIFKRVKNQKLSKNAWTENFFFFFLCFCIVDNGHVIFPPSLRPETRQIQNFPNSGSDADVVREKRQNAHLR